MEQPRDSFDRKFDNGRFSREEAPAEPERAEAAPDGRQDSRKTDENDGEDGAGSPGYAGTSFGGEAVGNAPGDESHADGNSSDASEHGEGGGPDFPGGMNGNGGGCDGGFSGSFGDSCGNSCGNSRGNFPGGGAGGNPNASGYGDGVGSGGGYGGCCGSRGNFPGGGAGGNPNAPGYGNGAGSGGSFGDSCGNSFGNSRGNFPGGGAGGNPNASAYGNGAGSGGFGGGYGGGNGAGRGNFPGGWAWGNLNAPGYGNGAGYGNFSAGGGGNYPNGLPYGNGAAYPNFSGGGWPPNYGNNAGYPYPQWYGNNGYGPFPPPPRRSNIGIIVIVVLSVLTALALVAGVFYGTYRLISSTYRMGERLYQTSRDTSDTYGDASFAGEDEEEQAPGDEKKYGDYGQDAEYYDGLTNAVRTDLSYSVSWEEYRRESGGEEMDGRNSYISVKYPVIEGGDIPNLENLNKAITAEIDEISDMYDEFSSYMAEDGTFEASAEGFVTYMDEDVMSVVFEETFLLAFSEYDGYDALVSLNSINLDMESGMVIDSNSIIDTDDEFAIDFRKRSEEQNGTVEDMDMMSDQQISDYLSGEETGVAFFTPLGMEVGFNYNFGWVTVTYKDYDKYLRKF